MNTTDYKYFRTKFFLLSFVLVTFISCDREASEKTTFATFTNNPEVFIDAFSSGLDYYPFGDSYFEAFEVDEKEAYEGEASMRFDIPNYGEGYGGAIFRDDNGGRNLTEYNALTFWARATKGTTIDQIGFGQDFGENKYQVTVTDLALTTGWKQYTIPIPDASKLIKEQGLFWYATGATETNTDGYSFWVDELKFENLKTIGQPRPTILDGVDEEQEAFVGTTVTLTGLTETFNLESGDDLTMTVSPSYYTFISSDIDVARVSELGVVTIVSEGTAVITATLNGLEATGSLTLNVEGSFDHAPTPTIDESNVISIFSDAYTNISVDTFNPYWQESATQGADDVVVGDDNLIYYTSLDFVAILFDSNIVDATAMTYLHMDINTSDAPADFTIQLIDFGEDLIEGGDDDSVGVYTVPSSEITTDTWVSLDIPISDFTGLNSQEYLARIILSSGGINDLYVDNIYFYTE